MFITNLLQNPISFLVFVVALLVAITIHEFAHAYIAFRSGDLTAKVEGRLSLNPLVHLDPIGTLFLLIAGFGWGKPVPVNPHNFKKRSDELKVALAGIVANIILAFILSVPIRIALATGQSIDSSLILSSLNLIIWINIVLAAFNLLPFFPLDGSHVVEYFLRGETKLAFRTIGPYLLLGLLLLDRLTGSSILFTIMEPILRLFSFLVQGSLVSPLS